MSRPLRIGVGMCVHNEADFIEYSLRGIYHFADVIAVCVNVGVPWGGEREEIDSTYDLVRGFPDPDSKLRLVPGEWADEIDQRNASLDTVRDEADYFMVLDADEFYAAADLARIRRYIARRPWIGQFRVRVNTYWKTNPVWRIDPPEPLKQYIVSRVRASTRFVGLRMTNERWRTVIPRSAAVLHHFSYSRPSQSVLAKIRNFSHRDQVKRDWFERVWKGWDANPCMENLHPTNPPEYRRAVCVRPSELPEVMRSHPYVVGKS